MKVEFELNIDKGGSPYIKFKHYNKVDSLEHNLLKMFIDAALKNGIELSKTDGYTDVTFTDSWEEYKVKACDKELSVERKVEEKDDLLVDGRVPIFHIVMDRDKLGLSHGEAMQQDMASEYVVIEDPDANAGIIVYAKYNGKWCANPYSTRFLIRMLLEKCGISLPSLKRDYAKEYMQKEFDSLSKELIDLK